MTDKSLKVYVGEDRLPVHDLTAYVNWPDSRMMGQAYNGQSAISSIRFRDEDGTFGPWTDSPITLAAKNEVEVKHGSNFLFRGRLIGRTWERGVQKSYKAREVVAEAEDVNVELRGIIVDQYVRPAETDKARVQGLISTYLSGGIRAGALINGSNWVSSSNLQTLPAKTYNQTDPLGVMSDIAFQTDKQFFVTIDKEMWYDGYDSTAYASPFYITDNEAELRADPTHALAIVPDSGPLFAINGQQFAGGLRVYYGSGSTDYIDVVDPAMEAVKAVWRETVYAPESVTSVTEATDYAHTLLKERSQDGRTFQLSVSNATGGPLTEAQIGSIKPGHLIRIKSRVIPLFPNYAFYTTRIVTLQWHMPLPGQYFATLKLERPEKAYGNGTKPGPRAPSGSTTASCSLSASEMDQISTPNSGFENGNATNWVLNGIGSEGVTGPGTGDWEGSYYGFVNGAGSARYNYLASTTFTAGITYVFRVRTSAANDTTLLAVATPDYATTHASTPVPSSGGMWAEHCMEWTPGSTVGGIGIAVYSDVGLDNFLVDDLRVYTGSSSGGVASVGGTGTGDPGTPGIYAPLTHAHEHGDITTGGPYHMAEDVTIADAGGLYSATTVEGALQQALVNPMTTIGDVIRGGAAGAPTRLAIGASNTIFKGDGASPLWSNTARLSYIDIEEHLPPSPAAPASGMIRIYGSNSRGYYKNASDVVVELGGSGSGGSAATYVGVKVFNSANVPLGTGTETQITFDSESWDTHGFHAGSSGDLVIPANQAGKYRITAQARVTATPGVGYGFLQQNAGIIALAGIDHLSSAPSVIVTTEAELAVGDAIKFFMAVANASKNATFNAGHSPMFMLSKIG